MKEADSLTNSRIDNFFLNPIYLFIKDSLISSSNNIKSKNENFISDKTNRNKYLTDYKSSQSKRNSIQNSYTEHKSRLNLILEKRKKKSNLYKKKAVNLTKEFNRPDDENIDDIVRFINGEPPIDEMVISDRSINKLSINNKKLKNKNKHNFKYKMTSFNHNYKGKMNNTSDKKTKLTHGNINGLIKLNINNEIDDEFLTNECFNSYNFIENEMQINSQCLNYDKFEETDPNIIFGDIDFSQFKNNNSYSIKVNNCRKKTVSNNITYYESKNEDILNSHLSFGFDMTFNNGNSEVLGNYFDLKLVNNQNLIELPISSNASSLTSIEDYKIQIEESNSIHKQDDLNYLNSKSNLFRCPFSPDSGAASGNLSWDEDDEIKLSSTSHQVISSITYSDNCKDDSIYIPYRNKSTPIENNQNVMLGNQYISTAEELQLVPSIEFHKNYGNINTQEYEQINSHVEFIANNELNEFNLQYYNECHNDIYQHQNCIQFTDNYHSTSIDNDISLDNEVCKINEKIDTIEYNNEEQTYPLNQNETPFNYTQEESLYNIVYNYNLVNEYPLSSENKIQFNYFNLESKIASNEMPLYADSLQLLENGNDLKSNQQACEFLTTQFVNYDADESLRMDLNDLKILDNSQIYINEQSNNYNIESYQYLENPEEISTLNQNSSISHQYFAQYLPYFFDGNKFIYGAFNSEMINENYLTQYPNQNLQFDSSLNKPWTENLDPSYETDEINFIENISEVQNSFVYSPLTRNRLTSLSPDYFLDTTSQLNTKNNESSFIFYDEFDSFFNLSHAVTFINQIYNQVIQSKDFILYKK